jgi:hypothetical protein
LPIFVIPRTRRFGSQAPRIDARGIETPIATDFEGGDFGSPDQPIDGGLIDLQVRGDFIYGKELLLGLFYSHR